MTASLKLYELVDLRMLLDAAIADAEGELTPETEAQLDDLAFATEEKIEKVALYVREQQATADAIEKEADRLAAIAKAKKRGADSLKDYLKRQMERLGTTRVNGLLATVALQTSPPSVKCALTPEQLAGLAARTKYVVIVPQTYKLDARAVIEAHKGGTPLPDGITVEDHNTHIRIR